VALHLGPRRVTIIFERQILISLLACGIDTSKENQKERKVKSRQGNEFDKVDEIN
jgi:hypothetical protein